MELEELINKISNDREMATFRYGFPSIKRFEDLEGFEGQSSDIEGIEFEYINQCGDDCRGFYGQVAFKFGSKGLCLVIDYHD